MAKRAAGLRGPTHGPQRNATGQVVFPGGAQEKALRTRVEDLQLRVGLGRRSLLCYKQPTHPTMNFDSVAPISLVPIV